MFRKFLNLVFFTVKKFIFSFFVIYTFNIFSISMNFIIPMNLFNILLVMFLGFPFIIGTAIFSLIF